MEQLRDELFKKCPNNGCTELVLKSDDATHAEECDRKPISVWNGGNYIGDCKDGKPHGDGKGTIRLLINEMGFSIPFWLMNAECEILGDDYEICTYEGQWKDGQPHGCGEAELHLPEGPCTCTYTGEWQKNRPHGKGTAEVTVHTTLCEDEDDSDDPEKSSEDGIYYKSYTGWWKRGLRHGFGELQVTQPGKMMRIPGQWENDNVRHGRLGKNTLYESYLGELLPMANDFATDFPMPHGNGKMEFENGDRYCGQFVHGKPRMLHQFLLSNGKTAPTDHGGSSASPQGGSSASPQGGSSASPQGGSSGKRARRDY
jgi:hypothetical protein